MSARSNQDGFTLSEMLVGLMVLGFVASVVSASLGTAFTSTDRLQNAAHDMSEQAQLRSILSELGDQLWLENGPTEIKVIEEIKLASERFDGVRILDTIGGEFQLIAVQGISKGQEIETPVHTSSLPLRIAAIGSWDRSLKSYDYHKIALQHLDADWTVIDSVHLKVDQNPACRFDIVARGCRS